MTAKEENRNETSRRDLAEVLKGEREKFEGQLERHRAAIAAIRFDAQEEKYMRRWRWKIRALPEGANKEKMADAYQEQEEFINFAKDTLCEKIKRETLSQSRSAYRRVLVRYNR